MEFKANDNLELIIKLIKEGYLIKEVAFKTGLSEKEINETLKTLEQTKPSLAAKIENQKLINLVRFRSKMASENHAQNKKSEAEYFENLALIILKRHLSYEEALKFTNLSATDFQNNLATLISPELKESLLALFKRRREYPELIVNNYSFNRQQEIIQLALTYRVSIESLAKLLKTSIDDIELLFANQINKIGYALQYLQEETNNEPEKNRLVAYEKAQNYLTKRSELCRRIKLAKQNNQEKEVLKLTMLLNQLSHEIDDSIVINARQNKVDLKKLSQEQKEKIGRYRLKYALPFRSSRHGGAINDLKISQRSLELIENEIKESDPIFASKIDQLDNIIKNYELNSLYESTPKR